jgi:putative transposase
MPFYHRAYRPGEFQFITTLTYRRTRLFLSDRFRRSFVQSLEEVRQEWHFLLVGWVLMPEHFHVLIKPDPAETTAVNKIQQKLDDRHNHPVTRGLVSSPGDWPWSSWRFYYLEDSSILAMDRLP